MKLIELTQGLFAKVDDEDYEYLMQWRWYANKIGNSIYALRGVRLPKPSKEKGVYGKVMHLAMHRVIMKTRADHVVDHRDGDGLNCQKHNMRNCKHGSNLKNKRKKVGKLFKGVYKVGRATARSKYPYFASICSNGTVYYLGKFKTPEEGAVAYDKAAKRMHGSFANINTASPSDREALEEDSLYDMMQEAQEEPQLRIRSEQDND